MHKEDVILESPESKPKGTLILFHGLTGTPDEMLDVAQHFNTKGFRIVLPCLSGHGTSIEDLKTVAESKWLDDANSAYVEACRVETPFISTIGQSFGALLSLHLLIEHSDRIRTAALLSPPLRFSSCLRELLLHCLVFAPDEVLNLLGVVKKTHRKNPGFVRPRDAYPAHSVAAVARLAKIRKMLFTRLPALEAQMLVLQDPADHHVSVDAPSLLRQTAPRSVVENCWLPGAQHELAMGPQQARVLAELDDFIESRLLEVEA